MENHVSSSKLAELPYEVHCLVFSYLEMSDLLSLQLSHSDLAYLSENELFKMLMSHLSYYPSRYERYLKDVSSFKEFKDKMAELKKKDELVLSAEHRFCGDCGKESCSCYSCYFDDEGNPCDENGDFLLQGEDYCQFCGGSWPEDLVLSKDGSKQVHVCRECYEKF